MKPTTNWLLILMVLCIGVAIGVAYSRWNALKNQIASHDSRLAALEADYAKRVQIKTAAKTTWQVLSGGWRWLAAGILKIA